MIEVKSKKEISKYIDPANEKNCKQLFSYFSQEKSTNIISYYYFDFDSNKDNFYNVIITDFLRESLNNDDLYDKWNKIFDNSNILNNTPFDIKINFKKYNELSDISSTKDANLIFNQFLTILRTNTVSDKSNAFDKIINLFIAKIYDEITENKDFVIVTEDESKQIINGLKFQYIEKMDTPKSFLKRIYDLYKDGMKEYLKKEIIDYSDDEVIHAFKESDSRNRIFKIIEDLRLKKDNTFAFIEVFDDQTFLDNFYIVKEIVTLLQNFRFKYNYKFQFLGDFFEELLNTSWKQEAGQFFTPLPLVDFMVNSLPIKEEILLNISNDNVDFLPYAIDYACGSGHFLVSYMDKVQNIIENIDLTNIKKVFLDKISSYKKRKFSWAKEYVYGIEKDYRLTKTAKISSILNGDGEASIIHGDGINKFNNINYRGTILSSESNKINKFDYVISNPPYSVKGFMKNFGNNGIAPHDKTFDLLEQINLNDTAIENFFVERTHHLLKNNGIASIILPQSFLSNSKYSKIREWVLKRFEIKAILSTGDTTFSGTTTSPIIIFLKKTNNVANFDYNCYIINSPKMYFKSKAEEIKFLGYEFSDSKNKKGISIINDNLTVKYSGNVKLAINEDFEKIETDNNSYVVRLNDIILHDNIVNEYALYPRFIKETNKNPIYLKSLCSLENSNNKEKVISNKDLKYIEISNIKNNNIIGNFKDKDSNKIAFKGDIIISSLTPKPSHVVLLQDNYKVSSAIIVLSFVDKNIAVEIYNYLIENKDDVFSKINSLLDGFKITYAKISEHNLLNYVPFYINFPKN